VFVSVRLRSSYWSWTYWSWSYWSRFYWS